MDKFAELLEQYGFDSWVLRKLKESNGKSIFTIRAWDEKTKFGRIEITGPTAESVRDATVRWLESGEQHYSAVAPLSGSAIRAMNR